VKGIAPGKLFTMRNFAREDQNKEYLVVSAEYELDSDAFESGGTRNNDEPVFNCRFTAIDRSDSPRVR
jgi:type VI secretion system secreted protein VgrG